MNKIAKYLNQHIVGNAFDRSAILNAYATDRSVLKITPRIVVVPENLQDIRKTVKFSSQLKKKGIEMPITVRGAGLDKTGADLGNGIILSMEKMSHIQEIDDRARLVRVQAGITLEKLNSALAMYGLTLPIDANPKETIGSLIANFTTDPVAGKYNGIYYYVDRIEAVLSDGDVIQTRRMNKTGLRRMKGKSNFEGSIYRDIDDILESNFDVVDDLAAKNTVDPAGYQMIAQVNQPKRTFDLMPLFYASQGTLGVITEVILKVELIPSEAKRIIVTFNSINPALDYLESIYKLEPSRIDIYDGRIFKSVEDTGKESSLFAAKFNNGYAVMISFDDRHRKAEKKLNKAYKCIPENAAAVIEDEDNMEDFERIKSAITSYLNDEINGERVSLVDDFYVPNNQLSLFLPALKDLEKVYNTELMVYGSVSTNNYSVRPDIELNTIAGRQSLMKFLKDFAKLVAEHNGSITGGAAEGRTKAIVTNQRHKKKETEVYNKIKEAFDPDGILNPEVKLGSDIKTTVRHLRTSYNHTISTE